MSTRLNGIDLSKWQVWWTGLSDNVVQFAFLRSSYGMMKDKLFDTFYAVAIAVGIPVGVYHYFSSGSPWQEQADFVIGLIKGKRVHKIALDFEGAYNNFSRDFALCAIKWMKYVEAETGIEVVIYTNPYVYRDNLLAHTAEIHDFKLWIAQYPVRGWSLFVQKVRELMTSKPYIALTGRDADDWWGWQYTMWGDGAKYGVGSHHIDLDQLNEGVVFVDEDVPPPTDEPHYEELTMTGKLFGQDVEVTIKGGDSTVGVETGPSPEVKVIEVTEDFQYKTNINKKGKAMTDLAGKPILEIGIVGEKALAGSRWLVYRYAVRAAGGDVFMRIWLGPNNDTTWRDWYIRKDHTKVIE